MLLGEGVDHAGVPLVQGGPRWVSSATGVPPSGFRLRRGERKQTTRQQASRRALSPVVSGGL